jgi:hypothetical protein
MSFVVTGLDPAPFRKWFGAGAAALERDGVVRRIADSRPGFPCRVTLEDAEAGERVLLFNHESHDAPTPYRSAYAIYVREGAPAAARYVDEIPPVMRARPLALRWFDANGMLIGASLALQGDAREKILAAFANPQTDYIHVHNAAHGCFAARVDRLASVRTA